MLFCTNAYKHGPAFLAVPALLLDCSASSSGGGWFIWVRLWIKDFVWVEKSQTRVNVFVVFAKAHTDLYQVLHGKHAVAFLIDLLVAQNVLLSLDQRTTAVAHPLLIRLFWTAAVAGQSIVDESVDCGPRSKNGRRPHAAMWRQ